MTVYSDMWEVTSSWTQTTKMTVFWNVEPCSLVETGRRFRGCLHHQGECASETSVKLYDTTGHRPLFVSRVCMPFVSMVTLGPNLYSLKAEGAGTIGRLAETWTRNNGVFGAAEDHCVRTARSWLTASKPQSSRTTTIAATKQNHLLPRVTVVEPREDLKQTAYRLV
jgi:hypothetical protein